MSLARRTFRTVGSLSEGVSLGFRSGFDSGRMMDYIYRNRPAGRGPAGRLIDRVYLEQPGCRALRHRCRWLTRTLAREITCHRMRGHGTVLLDVASGEGRYVLEALQRAGDASVRARCQDLDEEALQTGRRRAEALGLRNVTFARANALEAVSLLCLEPRPNLVVATGLYEILPHDAQIRHSLRLIGRLLDEGGTLVFTTQVGHPQLRLIAWLLVNQRGEPWLMRNRNLAEVETWVKAAGFGRVESQVDPEGIFGLTVARR